ncbi:uncharacterized protein [Patagioenas fasciata]|uniref:uncharacterized protein n=1 Tax=Patagioenas fasciata TaxID=372321 RepID=UPI003A9A4E2F
MLLLVPGCSPTRRPLLWAPRCPRAALSPRAGLSPSSRSRAQRGPGPQGPSPALTPHPLSQERASLQDLWEEINKFKEVQSSLAEDVREMKEEMQKAHSGLAEDIQEMKEAHVGLTEDMRAMQEAHSGLAEDIQEIQETLGLEGAGGQSAPAEPTQVATDTRARKSSALGPKGRGTQPEMETSKGTAGSGSPGMQAGTQGEPVTSVKLSGAPADHAGSCGAGATTPGLEPGSPGTQASTSLGTQPGAPDAQASTSGMQPGSPGTQATTALGTQPGAPDAQASTSGVQPRSPGTHTTTPGVQPGSSTSQATIPGDAQEPAKPWGTTSTSSYESEMREVLSQVGQLGHLCAGLKEQVEQLKSTKAEHADLENVRRLFPEGGRQSITSILADLKCQMSFLQDMAGALHGQEEKIRKVEDAPRKMRGAGAGRKADGSAQMTQQPRPKGQKVKAERKELGKQQEPTQAELEQFAAEYVNQLVMETAQQLQAEALSQALERLKKQKADKEQLLVLEIDEKADKAALADKVSRRQFEACEERLNKAVEEVTSRVTGQEEGWHRFQKELQRQMDCKLDRRELGAFREQQEERWKSLSGQLQKELQPERDDAAGIRKQLLPGFHCLSCDRPLHMLAPGPERTGECRYPTVPRSCGGPHTLTPPRFQPQPPSTPRPSPPSARSPNKKDAMQLSGQDGTDGNRQDEQLAMMGGSQLPPTPRATPDTSTSLLSAVLLHRPVPSPRRFTLAPSLLPPIQPPRGESPPDSRAGQGSRPRSHRPGR